MQNYISASVDLRPDRRRNSKLEVGAFLLFGVYIFCAPVSAKYASGTGTADDPYQIATAEQLLSIGSDPNLLNKHFVLVADIDMDPNLPGREVLAKALIAPYPENAPYETNTTFTGSFDGDGRAIRNLFIDAPGGWNIGIFGFVGSGGQVKNLWAKNISINGRYIVGGLAGQNWGVITGCHIVGRVCGRANVGGLVGRNGSYDPIRSGANGLSDVKSLSDEPVEGTILACSADVHVVAEVDSSGIDLVGGLVGLNSGGIIRYCRSSGSARGEGGVGGLLGANGKGHVDNSYSDSTVQGYSAVAGLIGYNDDNIMLCYSVGLVTGEKRVGGLVGSGYGGSTYLCYWDVQTSGLGSSSGGRGKSTDQMKSRQTFRGWGYQVQWTIDEGNDYPHLAWEGLPGTPILEAPCEYGGGTGKLGNPYQIWSAEQFLAIGYCWPDFDKHFVLMQDIDLNDIDPNLIVPIGTPGIPFSGSYDGNNHTISSFRCWSAGENYIGTFGHVGHEGVSKNVVISNADVIGSKNVGALAGRDQGSILNCFVSGHVRAERSVGGLAGSIGPNATVNLCSSTVDVAGESSVGGLVGYNVNGTISMCHSTSIVAASSEGAGGLAGRNNGGISYSWSHGHVSGQHAVGGLVGHNLAAISPAYSISYIGDISNSYSSASVDGNKRVGGLVGGNWGIISRCYSSGQVAGIEETGGLVGALYEYLWDYLGSIDNCYWDMDASGQETSAGGEGKTTAQMKQRASFVDWDFANVWGIAQNQTYPFLRRRLPRDLNCDDHVDMLDLVILLDHWLEGGRP